MDSKMLSRITCATAAALAFSVGGLVGCEESPTEEAVEFRKEQIEERADYKKERLEEATDAEKRRIEQEKDRRQRELDRIEDRVEDRERLPDR